VRFWVAKYIGKGFEFWTFPRSFTSAVGLFAISFFHIVSTALNEMGKRMPLPSLTWALTSNQIVFFQIVSPNNFAV
jgi:hypothetical protein